jgi:hypothetical protein
VKVDEKKMMMMMMMMMIMMNMMMMMMMMIGYMSVDIDVLNVRRGVEWSVLSDVDVLGSCCSCG